MLSMSRIFRPFKEGFLGVFRHGAMSFSAAIAVTLTLLIVSLFSIFTITVQQFTQGLEHSVLIGVEIDYSYESAEQEDAIGLAIQNIPGVTSLTYYDKSQELEAFLDSISDEKVRAVYETYRDDNPFHDAYYVEVEDGNQLESISEQIAEIEGVYSVNFGGTSAKTLINVLHTIRYGGGILAAALCILAVFLISNTIQLTISARADEIAIMRNVGAKNGFIRAPFLVEGVIIGALGAIVPIVATIYGYRYLYNFTGGYVISPMFQLLTPDPFVRYLCIGLLLMGMIVGLAGSFFAVTRYLRWKR